MNLQYIHNLEIWEKDIINLEDWILREEDNMNEKMTNIKIDKKDKREKNDNIETLKACP